jgi:hypothetical protein
MRVCGVVPAARQPPGVSNLRWCEQSFLDDHQVGEGEQGVQLRGVLGQPAVTQLAVPEQVLDQVEGMLDPGPHLRQRPLHRLRQVLQGFRQGFDDAALDRDVPGDLAVASGTGSWFRSIPAKLRNAWLSYSASSSAASASPYHCCRK